MINVGSGTGVVSESLQTVHVVWGGLAAATGEGVKLIMIIL